MPILSSFDDILDLTHTFTLGMHSSYLIFIHINYKLIFNQLMLMHIQRPFYFLTHFRFIKIIQFLVKSHLILIFSCLFFCNFYYFFVFMSTYFY